MKTSQLKVKTFSPPCGDAACGAKVAKRLGIPWALPTKSSTASNILRSKDMLFDLPHLVWVTDLSGRCVYVNRMFEEFTGADVEAFTNTAWVDFLHPDDVAATTAGWLYSVRHKTAHQTRYRVKRHDDTYLWMLARAVLVQDPAGHASHWVGTNTDVHELHELIHASHESRCVEQKFIRGLAQALRTPLGLIEFTAESALGDSEDQRGIEKYLRTILKHADRLGAVVEDLLHDEPA